MQPELPQGGGVGEGGLTRRGNGPACGSPLHGQSVARLGTLFFTGVAKIPFTLERLRIKDWAAVPG